MTGDALVKALGSVYYRHNMKDWLDAQSRNREDETAQVICSEALV
jgi:hypothetical protein